MNSKPRLRYHLGFRGNLTRTNLAYAIQHRDWRRFAGIAQTLMRRAAKLYRADCLGVAVSGPGFALDSPDQRHHERHRAAQRADGVGR